MKINCELCFTKRRTEKRGTARTQIKVRMLGGLFMAIAVAGSEGCTTVGVKPWQHDVLAEQAMQVDSYPLQSAIDDHIYFSKEASSGGRSFAGGGCGCN
jgi:hypothetical protein